MTPIMGVTEAHLCQRLSGWCLCSQHTDVCSMNTCEQQSSPQTCNTVHMVPTCRPSAAHINKHIHPTAGSSSPPHQLAYSCHNNVCHDRQMILLYNASVKRLHCARVVTEAPAHPAYWCVSNIHAPQLRTAGAVWVHILRSGQ